MNAGYEMPPYKLNIMPDINYLNEACRLKK